MGAMPITDSLIAELEMESNTTRRVLERVPSDKLTWKPHEKSMSLGRLAQHVATIPGLISGWSKSDALAIEDFKPEPEPTSTQEILSALAASVEDAKKVLAATDDTRVMGMWSMTAGGKPIFSVPRAGLLRNIMLNHLYHHRGQLSVYLRLLNVPVPSIYGPSADENPMEM